MESFEVTAAGCRRGLAYEDNSFDLVISINTIHNLERADLIQALQEIQRVTKKNAFITVDAYRNMKKRRNQCWLGT